MKKQRIAITGGTGFVGSRLLTYLNPDYELISLNRSGNTYWPPFDLADLTTLNLALDETNIDFLIHAGAMARRKECRQHPALAERVNKEATEKIVEWAKAKNVPMIFFSTNGVYEDNIYSKTKLEAENSIKNLQARCVIIRLSYTFGWSPSRSRPRPQKMLEEEYKNPGSQSFDDSWKFHPTGLGHVCETVKFLLNKEISTTTTLEVVAPEKLTMRKLASLCFPHILKSQNQLNKRSESTINFRNLALENIPTTTIQSLAEEIKYSFKPLHDPYNY